MVTTTKCIYMDKAENGDTINYIEGVCLSGDTKPTNVANGSRLLEMDTSKVLMFDAVSETWLEWGATNTPDANEG